MLFFINSVENETLLAGGMVIQNEYISERILLRTNKSWAGGIAVQDQCFSWKSVQNKTIQSRRMAFQKRPLSFRIILKTNKFWAGGMTVQNQCFFLENYEYIENQATLSRRYGRPKRKLLPQDFYWKQTNAEPEVSLSRTNAFP